MPLKLENRLGGSNLAVENFLREKQARDYRKEENAWLVEQIDKRFTGFKSRE